MFYELITPFLYHLFSIDVDEVNKAVDGVYRYITEIQLRYADSLLDAKLIDAAQHKEIFEVDSHLITGMEERDRLLPLFAGEGGANRNYEAAWIADLDVLAIDLDPRILDSLYEVHQNHFVPAYDLLYARILSDPRTYPIVIYTLDQEDAELMQVMTHLSRACISYAEREPTKLWENEIEAADRHLRRLVLDIRKSIILTVRENTPGSINEDLWKEILPERASEAFLGTTEHGQRVEKFRTITEKLLS